jgi:hypothetical protein
MLALASTASAVPAKTAPAVPAAAAVQVPADVTAGVAVFDRQTGTFTEQLNTSMQFRSASIVKLLLTLDYLGRLGPNYTIPAADRARLEPMLRSSDDQAANYYWGAYGGAAIVNRMVTELKLSDTIPPPAGREGFWGYTAMSARDIVTVYRYILEKAPVPIRDFIMTNLRQSTRCAPDEFDQHFGIAGAFSRPWAVKQGWSGFGEEGSQCGTAGTATKAVDLDRPALHTTGTVGANDRSIVAVLSLHPLNRTYGKAYTDLGRLTRSLNVPGGVRPVGKWYGTWSSGVNVRDEPNTGHPELVKLPAGVEVLIGCQTRGEFVSVPPYGHDWWVYLPQYDGYISSIYISHPDAQLPDVELCDP